MSALLPRNESRGPSLFATQWITVSIASLFVFLRIYTRAFLRKVAGADDWTIVVALVSSFTGHNHPLTASSRVFLLRRPSSRSFRWKMALGDTSSTYSQTRSATSSSSLPSSRFSTRLGHFSLGSLCVSLFYVSYPPHTESSTSTHTSSSLFSPLSALPHVCSSCSHVSLSRVRGIGKSRLVASHVRD